MHLVGRVFFHLVESKKDEYQGFGIRGYTYVKTEYEAGKVIFTICQEGGDLRCAVCGSRRVVRRGFQPRRFRSLPIGTRNVQVVLWPACIIGSLQGSIGGNWPLPARNRQLITDYCSLPPTPCFSATETVFLFTDNLQSSIITSGLVGPQLSHEEREAMCEAHW